jgi:hypothetical protein
MLPAAASPAIALVCALLPQFWAAHPLPSAIPAQVEQETCPSLTSRECFSPHAELKTAREYGFGLGQLTVTPTFNNFNTVKQQQPALRSWQWTDRFLPRPQLIALLTMDLGAYKQCTPLMGSPYDRLACAVAAYNGGIGGFRSDRRVCSNTKGCDPTKWFGNVALTSTKAKKPASGYGQSFFQINRAYVQNVLVVRRGKYVQPMNCGKE